MLALRPWQEKALKKSIQWLVEDGRDRHFLVNAAPGSGKTIAASVIAKTLIEMGLIDRVIVIAPRTEVVNQWTKDFKIVTGRFMGKVTGSEKEIEYDVAATWAAIEGLLDAFQAVCRADKTLVVCDEHHHAAVQAAWGEGANSAFAEAKYVLILTGTPIRSDKKKSVGSHTTTKGQSIIRRRVRTPSHTEKRWT